MPKIVDPDDLAITTDVVFHVGGLSPTIQILTTGAVDAADGVTHQCVYSFFIDEWARNESLREFPFPAEAIGTGEQFDLIDGWNWHDAATRAVLRDGGFSVRSAAGEPPTEAWANVVSLGDFEVPATHRAYYQQEPGGAIVQAARPGPMNQVVQILSDPNANGSFSGGFDRRGYFKVFLQEQGHLFDSYDLLVQQSIAELDYRKYTLPLSNRPDTKITTADTGIATGGSGAPDVAPFDDMSITYLAGSGFSAWANATDYAANAVVSDGGRWYTTPGGGTSNGTGTADDAGVTDWTAYSGERAIGGTYHAFNVIIDANVDNAGADPEAQRIYEFAQYMRRQNIDIDSGAGTVNGQTAGALLEFVGDTLKTLAGVWIDDFNANDINSIVFRSVDGVERTFPFTATISLEPGPQLRADSAAWYHVYMANDDAGDDAGHDWGTANAITVLDDAGAEMKGLISGSSQIVLGYNFDTNDQRGSGSEGEDVPIVVVAGGRGGAGYVRTTTTIRRSTANVAQLVAGQDRAYSNPA